MSYTPTSAGHEDASLEQRIEVEQDPEIEALVERVCPLINGTLWEKNDVNAYLETFFRSRKPWSQEQVKTALKDSRLSEQTICSLHPYASGLHYYDLSLEQLIAPIALRSCADMTLEDDGLCDAFCHMGQQPNRVLVDHTPHTARQSTIGKETSNTLYILTHRDSARPRLNFYLGASVVVDLTPSTGKGTRGDAFVDNTMYLYQKHRGLTVFCAELHDRKYLYFQKKHLQQLPIVDAYVDDVLQHCQDPHSLHSVYGPTPGPTIRKNIVALLTAYGREKILEVLYLRDECGRKISRTKQPVDAQ